MCWDVSSEGQLIEQKCCVRHCEESDHVGGAVVRSDQLDAELVFDRGGRGRRLRVIDNDFGAERAAERRVERLNHQCAIGKVEELDKGVDIIVDAKHVRFPEA